MLIQVGSLVVIFTLFLVTLSLFFNYQIFRVLLFTCFGLLAFLVFIHTDLLGPWE